MIEAELNAKSFERDLNNPLLQNSVVILARPLINHDYESYLKLIGELEPHYRFRAVRMTLVHLASHHKEAWEYYKQVRAQIEAT